MRMCISARHVWRPAPACADTSCPSPRPTVQQPATSARSHVLGALVQGLPMATPARGMLGASSFIMAPIAGR
jgi:hypothetical protein